jgi:hypothetical protein
MLIDMCPKNIGQIKVLGENNNSSMTKKKLAKNGINTTQSIAIHLNVVVMRWLPSLINHHLLHKGGSEVVTCFIIYVNNDLVIVKFYIVVGF